MWQLAVAVAVAGLSAEGGPDEPLMRTSNLIELSGAEMIRKSFKYGKLNHTSLVAYLPSEQHLAAYFEVVQNFGGDPRGLRCYAVTDRPTLETLGLYSGVHFALYRPWAGKKNFKVSYRKDITGLGTNRARFRDWILKEALEPVGFVTEDFYAAYEKASEVFRKPILKFFLNTNIPDPESVKPEDWDQPEKIPDPDAEPPEVWDEDEDGPWEANLVPNPAFKGQWKQQRKMTHRYDDSDQEPPGWDVPVTILDPAQKNVPDGWDPEEDGEWTTEEIPNPAYRGEWKSRKMPPDADRKRAIELLKPLQEKYGKKLIFVVANLAFDSNSKERTYRFTDEDFVRGKTVVIEDKKFSVLKYDNKDFGLSDFMVSPGRRFIFDRENGYDPEQLEAFIKDWVDKKLVDDNKKVRDTPPPIDEYNQNQ
eukprot:Hpha_TRINITY_DN17222_c0_g1::TRINITY_DN17222_c0_g1_i1::g.17869::m.17869